MNKPDKPLGIKAYGSIGHIHGSRLGPGDHTVSDGQTKICVHGAEGKTVYVQTKLDGSCVAAAKLDDGSIIALSRAGYLAKTSNYEMHHLWADWMEQQRSRFDEVLEPGERLVGEWLAQAHGTIYDLTHREPFVAFDIMRENNRVLLGEFIDRTALLFEIPDYTRGPMDPIEAMNKLTSYGADEPEGVVYRCESKKSGKVQIDFLAKWVRPDKEDGKYLKADPLIWNWRPDP